MNKSQRYRGLFFQNEMTAALDRLAAQIVTSFSGIEKSIVIYYAEIADVERSPLALA